MPLLDHELARRDPVAPQRLELRRTALRLVWTLPDLLSADGHQLTARLTASIRPLPDPTEQQMLIETFFTHARPGALTAEEVLRHFTPAFQSAAARLAPARTAAEWINPDAAPSPFLNTLLDAGRAVAFSCGLELLPPFHLDLQSPTLHRQQLEATQRHLTEQRTTGQIEHIQRAVSLLQQFQALREAAPELSPGRLLDQIAPADRASTLQTLLLASADTLPPQTLYLVAGPHLLRITPESFALAPLPLPAALGPLRSIRPVHVESQPRLLIGAQRGLLLVDPDCSSEAVLYPHDALASPLGFNSAAILGTTLYATHSDAGLIAWQLNDPAALPTSLSLPASDVPPGPRHDTILPTAALRSPVAAQGPRNLTRLDDHRLLFSLGTSLYVLDRARQLTPIPLAAGHPLLAIIPLPIPAPHSTQSPAHSTTDHEARTMDTLALIFADGSVQLLPAATLVPQPPQQRTGRLTAAAALPWLGSMRLLLASEDGPILCLGTEDTLITQYLGPYRGLRRLAGSAALIAALSPDRQRLVLWHPASPQSPSAEVPIAPTAGHRVADLTFA